MSTEFKDRVRHAADIAQIIGETVRLKPLGPSRLVGLCPFHQEKTPSFNVNRDKQFFYCFGCQKKGDVFTFLMEMEGVGFWDALKSLAERYGIPIPQRADFGDAETRERDALLRMQEIALTHYRESMNDASRQYLQARFVTAASLDEFGLGYAPPGSTLARRLEREGFTAEQMLGSGLILRRDDGSLYDRFRHRLMFPIHNEQGKVIAFGGRALGDDEPKYLNSSETRLYVKKRVLYNLHRAKETIRRTDATILVEGYMDVIGVAQAGVKNVVASCGTALSEDHVRTLRRHSDKVVVNFDPDKAGAAATERSIQSLLEESMRIRVLTLEGGCDPDEYVARHGAEAYRQRASTATNYFHWLADRARKQFDMTTAEGRMAGFRTLLRPALDRVSDKLERLAVASDLAGYLNVEAKAILDEIRKPGPVQRAQAKVAALPASEALLLRALVDNPREAALCASRIDTLSIWRATASAPILVIILQLAEFGEVSFEAIMSRLNETDQRLFASLVMVDKEVERVTAEQLYGSIQRMEQDEKLRGRAAVRERVRELERAGRYSEALAEQAKIDA